MFRVRSFIIKFRRPYGGVKNLHSLSFLDRALEAEVKLQDQGATRASDEEQRKSNLDLNQ